MLDNTAFSEPEHVQKVIESVTIKGESVLVRVPYITRYRTIQRDGFHTNWPMQSSIGSLSNKEYAIYRMILFTDAFILPHSSSTQSVEGIYMFCANVSTKKLRVTGIRRITAFPTQYQLA